MKMGLLTSGIWQTITAAAKATRQPSQVAVAYFAKGASKQLPIGKGSKLVVDASDAAVKSGQTCPAELAKMVGRGVRVYSVSNLHAKVFVLGKKAFVGSANVSHMSRDWLVEAMIVTADTDTVAAARSFIRDLCQDELGPKAISKLEKLYRLPKFKGYHGAKGLGPQLSRLFVANLSDCYYPEGSEIAYREGCKAAKDSIEQPQTHIQQDFSWDGKCPFQEGDRVVQVHSTGVGPNQRSFVCPPGRVIHVRRWKGPHRATTFVYLEVPKRKRKAIAGVVKKLGSGAKKRLQRNGKLRTDLAKKLCALWG